MKSLQRDLSAFCSPAIAAILIDDIKNGRKTETEVQQNLFNKAHALAIFWNNNRAIAKAYEADTRKTVARVKRWFPEVVDGDADVWAKEEGYKDYHDYLDHIGHPHLSN